ncbi:MAG: hypothetical protein LBB62_04490, partial [Proteiniphilum sp.]|nr:hypothetical protein [Proteiniphilum sp.]
TAKCRAFYETCERTHKVLEQVQWTIDGDENTGYGAGTKGTRRHRYERNDKKHQIWQWRAIDHDTGEVVAFRFGTRDHKNLYKLLELIKPLNIGKVYTNGNYAYYERFSSDVLVVTKKTTQKIERKHLSLRT